MTRPQGDPLGANLNPPDDWPLGASARLSWADSSQRRSTAYPWSLTESSIEIVIQAGDSGRVPDGHRPNFRWSRSSQGLGMFVPGWFDRVGLVPGSMTALPAPQAPGSGCPTRDAGWNSVVGNVNPVRPNVSEVARLEPLVSGRRAAGFSWGERDAAGQERAAVR